MYFYFDCQEFAELKASTCHVAAWSEHCVADKHNLLKSVDTEQCSEGRELTKTVCILDRHTEHAY
jgi:hypothetical protein